MSRLPALRTCALLFDIGWVSSSSLVDGLVFVPLISGHRATEKEGPQENDDGPGLAAILSMEVFDALQSMTGGARDIRDELVAEEGVHVVFWKVESKKDEEEDRSMELKERDRS